MKILLFYTLLLVALISKAQGNWTKVNLKNVTYNKQIDCTRSFAYLKEHDVDSFYLIYNDSVLCVCRDTSHFYFEKFNILRVVNSKTFFESDASNPYLGYNTYGTKHYFIVNDSTREVNFYCINGTDEKKIMSAYKDTNIGKNILSDWDLKLTKVFCKSR